MNITVLHDRVLILPDKIEERATASGIVIAPSSTERPQTGSVVGVGPEVKDIAAGDRVIFGKHDGQKLPINDVQHLVLREEQVLGIICK